MSGTLPLEGIRVIDFGQGISAPYCAMLLAEMGAEVISVEAPSRATPNRAAAGFNDHNASKKSVTIDLKNPAAVQIAKRLVGVSDIVVHNLSTGTMDRLGLGYDALRTVKPNIIMLSVSAIGITGPRRLAAGYHTEVNAFSGMASLVGYRNRGPEHLGSAWTDHFSALAGVFPIVAALHHRERTGQGQHIDLSMCDNLLATAVSEALLGYAGNGGDAGRQENEDAYYVPQNVYRCAGFDKWVAISVTSEVEWHGLCEAMGDPQWCGEQRFADPVARRANRQELDARISEWVRERTDYEAMESLQSFGVPAGPVLSAEGLIEDPHLKERGYLVQLGELGGQPVFQTSVPWRLDGCPQPVYRLAPRLGEHNEYVLRDLLGLSPTEIASLTASEATAP